MANTLAHTLREFIASMRRRGHGSLLRGVRFSLTARCLAILAIYAAFIAGTLLGVSFSGDAIFSQAFPSMETVLAHQDVLDSDKLDGLRIPALLDCRIVVFDGDDHQVYASSTEAAEQIPAAVLPIVPNHGDGAFYEVFQEKTGNLVQYRVVLCHYGIDDPQTKIVDSWCALDENLRVVTGDLFVGEEELTRLQFSFIRDTYEAHMGVSRLDYLTDDGQARTLVLVTPLMSQQSYERVTNEIAALWLLAVPVVLTGTAIAAFVLAWNVRRSVRPLERAIEEAQYSIGSAVSVATEKLNDDEGVPTELTSIYDAFVDLMGQLRASHDERQRLIADVSHDLKTPLTVIRGYSQAFCEGRVPADRAEAYHRAIFDKSCVAAELLDLLCAHARMEHPEFTPLLVRTDVAALIARIGASATPQVEQAGCTLQLAPCAIGTAWALIDERLCERAIGNLIDNACSHNPAGITIELGCKIAGSSIEIWVNDTGDGFDPAIAERAFEAFVTENVARTSGQGTGLGLTIARKAAQLMGGTLQLQSTPPQGWSTSLVITLPLNTFGSSSTPTQT